jgi:DMSO/TMAO reductase YedYZ molybdopterin-dependent catalytic subunit
MLRNFLPRIAISFSPRIAITFLLVAFVQFFVRAQTAPAPATLRVEGEVAQPLTLQVADLAAMKHTVVRAKDHDEKEHSFSGVAVAEILQRAGTPLGSQLRGKNMTKFLLIKAKDGYQTIFTLAELDSSFTDRPIILADQVDGVPLSADKGPFRIIVPGEKKHARWTWGVTTFIVKSGGE